MSQTSGARVDIPITKPVLGDEERLAIQQPLESGWIVQGPQVKAFEARFAAFTGSPYAAATTSCTTALHLAVASLGLGPGDEVIVPAFTWVSTANVVEYMGATPIFCDVDLSTFNIRLDALASLVTSRTVGIIPVHLFGLCADMSAVLEVAARRGLWVVEDAACAFGARWDGRHAGTFGAAGCFSFHPRKAITTGEGGMVTTARAELDQVVRSLRDHGASRSDLSRHGSVDGALLPSYDRVGYNYRMTDLQAALGCAQMGRAEWILAERTNRARRYDALLTETAWLQTPAVPERAVHGYQSYVCLFRPEAPTVANAERLSERRNRLMRFLAERGIAARQGTHAPVLLGYYARTYGLRPEQFPGAYLADQLSMALPLFPQLTDGEQELVCATLQEGMDA